MPNPYVLQRLGGIREALMALHRASAPLTNETKGLERETLIDSFLADVFPGVFRFGTGDATDAKGNRSGQLDVVIEFPFVPSLPSIGGGQKTRLYLAEAIAAVVEVKSNIAAQWRQAEATAAQLAPLRREYGGGFHIGRKTSPTIPLFVVGYTGWSQMETLEEHLDANSDVAGILVIESGLFASSSEYDGVRMSGDEALWGLIAAIQSITNRMVSAATDTLSYTR